MKPWPKHPVIYEINTWVWLRELSAQVRGRRGPGDVPAQEWDAMAAHGFDAVWLMGVWERSPAGIAISMQNSGPARGFQAGPSRLLGRRQRRLAVLRAPLRGRCAPRRAGRAWPQPARRSPRAACAWCSTSCRTTSHRTTRGSSSTPSTSFRGVPTTSTHDPASFVEADGKVFACGRDPYFPAWPDVLQLNAFQPGLRQAVVETVSDIAGQCDAIRCDMAMLLLNDIFERTWGARAGARPADDYWRTVIPAVKSAHPDFKFIAEAYWDLEWELQQQGFDACYDKKLYDRMEHGPAEQVRQHLLADRPLPGRDGPVHREPRRAQGRGGVPRRQGTARRRSPSSRFPDAGCCTRGSSRG